MCKKRKVTIAYTKKVGSYDKTEFIQNRGWFQAWSQTQVPSSRNNLIMIPIAIIEHENGTVFAYDLSQFKFKDWEVDK